MRFLEFLARAFIRTFGITEPEPKQVRVASWFIGGLLAFVIVLMVVAGLLLRGILNL